MYIELTIMSQNCQHSKCCQHRKYCQHRKLQNHYRVVKPLEIALCDVAETAVHTLVTASVKVQKCERPSCIGSKTKQTVVVSDMTGSIAVHLWEEHIGSLEEGKSYCLECFRIAEYDSEKYLALCRDGSKIAIIEDIADVMEHVVGGSSIIEVENCSLQT